MVAYMYRHKDPLNEMKKRNIHNTDKGEYNCAGYALETFSWYCPYPDDSAPCCLFFTSWNGARKKTDFAVQTMLHDFPTLRVIHTFDEAQPDEYIILFRLDKNGDFHYLKRDSHGHWRHKMGGNYYIDTMPAREIFQPWPPCGKYCGPIVILAKRR